jgi:hypothetical protein
VWLTPAVLIAGCGDDDGEPAPTDGGMDGGGMDGGSQDDAGSDASTPPPPPRFMCGDVVCFVPGEDLLDLFEGLGFAAGPAPYSPCCTDDDNLCGLVVSDADAGTAECVGRPPSDPQCPDIDLFGVLQPGCCIEEMGFCGVNAAQVGAGCLDATGGLGPLFGLEPVACGELDGGTAADAGQ